MSGITASYFRDRFSNRYTDILYGFPQPLQVNWQFLLHISQFITHNRRHYTG